MIAVVQQAVSPSATGGGTTLSTPPIATTPGNCLAVFVRSSAIGDTITITNTAGDAFTAAAACSQGGIGDNQWFYAKNIAGNAADIITATWAGGSSFRAVAVYELSGIDLVNPYDAGPACKNNGAGVCVSSAFTTTQPDEILLTGITSGALGVAYLAGGGATLGTAWADGDGITQFEIVSAIQTGVTTSITSGSGGLVNVMTLAAPGAPPGNGATVALIAAEVLSAPLSAPARAAQIAVEVLHSISTFVPPGGGTGRWFSDLWDPDMIDDPGDTWQV